MKGYAIGALWTPLGSHLTAPAASGTTVLTVEHGGDFGASGLLDIAGERIAYTATGDSLALAAPLSVAAEADEPVSLVVGGQVVGLWHLLVDLGDGDTVPIPIPLTQRSHWPLTETFPEPIPVEVSDDLSTVLDAPARTPAFDAGYAVVQSVTADKMSVGAAGLTVPNGTFEDSSVDALFAGWRPSFWTHGTEAERHIEDTHDGIAGSRSLVIRLDTGAAMWGVVTSGDTLPVRPGQRVTLSCMVSADRTIASSVASFYYPALAQLILETSAPDVEPEDVFNMGAWHQYVSIDALTTTPVEISQTFVIPAGHYRARVSCMANPSGSTGYSALFDQVTLTTVAAAEPTPDVVIPDWTTFRDAQGRTIAQALGLTTSTSVGKTFLATATRWYSGTGVRQDNGREIKQGNGSDTFGNRRGAIWWDSAAVAAALGSGAGYSKVEIRLTETAHAKAIANNVYLGTHTDATVRSAWVDITGKVTAALTAHGFRVGSAVWVDITSILSVADLVTQSKRGLLVGPAPSDSLDYALTVAGASASNTTAPLLRVS